MLGAPSRSIEEGNCFPAGSRPYRVVELGEVGPAFLPGSLGLTGALGLPLAGPYTFGVNRHLEVVWFGVTDATNPPEVGAFVTLQFANYGLAAGTYQLPIPSSAPGGGLVAAAMAINDDGVVVGLVGSRMTYTVGEETRAFVWRLADSSLSSPATIPDGEEIDLNEIPDLSCFSAALALTDDAPIEAVGIVHLELCPSPCEETEQWTFQPYAGFRTEVDDALTAVALLGPGGSPTWALAVTPDTTEFDVDRLVFGRDWRDSPLPENCVVVTTSIECPSSTNSQADAVFWDGTTASVLDRANPAHQASAYGTDNAGHVVGTSGCGADPDPTAAFWESVTDDVVDLGAVCDPAIVESARATAVFTVIDSTNEDEIVTVVGGDDLGDGRIWGRVGGGSCDWCCDTLSLRALPPLGSDAEIEYTIEFAHAIAPTGHVVAYGFETPTGPRIAILLTCAADLDGDSKVNGADLGIHLNTFGTCPSSGACDADLNADGEIDSADLGLLLLAWSGDDVCEIRPLGGGCPESALLGGPTIEGAVDLALAALGFSSSEQGLQELATWYGGATAEERFAFAEALLAAFNHAHSTELEQ